MSNDVINKIQFEQPTQEKIEEFIRRMGTDRESIKKNVAVLKSWLASDPFLPTVEDEVFLERFHSHCKFDMEKTRKKLENYFKTRALEPEIMLIRDPIDADIIQTKNVVPHITLPLLTPEGYRVTIIKLFNTDPELFNPELMLKSALMTLDANINEDLSEGRILILDSKGTTPQHFFKFTPTFLKKADTCSTKAYPHRYANIHVVNVMNYMHTTLSIFKMILGNKLGSRLITHLNYETLHDYVPKNILPKEFGGTYPHSLEEIRDLTYEKMVMKRDWFAKQRTICADIKTCKDSFNEEFGCKGTFRRIEID
ncbi:alpha-tocopherol transfer protein-like [Lycorma delicatula]|uniref:alpha-tocopherol transfer protein-like n=1 Tax=Lycorma delicatula TaxID=130591 RepID=UPI003F5145EE